MSLSSDSCFRYFFFFFQAEDGIRDSSVTGVQTCALPISESSWPQPFTPPFWSSASGDRRCGVLGFRDRQDKRLGLTLPGHHCWLRRDGHFPRVVRCALSSVVRPLYRSAPVPHPSVHGSRAGYRSVFGGLWRAFAVGGVVGSDDLGLVGSEDRPRDGARPAAHTRR